VLHAARTKYTTKNYAKIANCAPSHHNMVNFGVLTAEIGSGVWGTPANFNGFRILASLLQRRHSLEANQTLHDVWPSPGLVHYLYIFWGSRPLTECCQVQTCKLHFASKTCFLLHWQHYCTVLEQWVSAKICGVLHEMELWYFRRQRHLYSAARPSRWASPQILV